MVRKKTAAELRTELRLLHLHGIGNNITKVFRDLIKWGAILGIAYFAFLSIESLSGKRTEADIAVKAEGALSMDMGTSDKKAKTDPRPSQIAILLALIFGIGGIAYGRYQAKLRKDVIERYHPLIQEAERLIDQNRSSSKLTDRGDTRPEDE